MNIEEYRRRINDTHTVTGIPSYWQEFQSTLDLLVKATSEKDCWKLSAEKMAEFLVNCPDFSHMSKTEVINHFFLPVAEGRVALD